MTRAKDISKIVTDANLSGTLDVTGTVTAGGNLLVGTNTNAVYYNSVSTYNASAVIKTSTSNDVADLVLVNGDNNFGSTIDFARTNTSSNDVRFALIGGYVDSNTAGSESGNIRFSTKDTGDSNIVERMRIDSSGNVGIGSAATAYPLEVFDTNGNGIAYKDTTNSVTNFLGAYNSVGISGTLTNHPYAIWTNNTEAMRIDSNRTLIIGETTTNAVLNGTGVYINGGTSGSFYASATGTPHFFNRQEDGNILSFRVGGVDKGHIGVISSDILYLANPDGTGVGLNFDGDDPKINPTNGTGSGTDGVADLGWSGGRFKNLYLSGGVAFDTGTAANYLDDYEEGTWTPSVTYTNASSWSCVECDYTKIGRMVFILFRGTANVTSNTTATSIALSFPFIQTGVYSGGGIVLIEQGTSPYATLRTIVTDGTSAIGGNIGISFTSFATGTHNFYGTFTYKV